MAKTFKTNGKVVTKATQLVSRLYSKKRIEKNSQHKVRNDEDMQQIFNNIIHDPHIKFGMPDKSGNYVIYYNNHNIGWLNPVRGIGWINDDSYEFIEKYVDPEIGSLDQVEIEHT
jgi:hypothetical protein